MSTAQWVLSNAWVIWLAVFLLLAIVEMLSLDLYFIMLGVGSLGGLAVALAGGPVASLEVELAVFALDFDGDDAVLAVGGANNQVQLFDVTTPEAPVPVGEPLD